MPAAKTEVAAAAMAQYVTAHRAAVIDDARESLRSATPGAVTAIAHRLGGTLAAFDLALPAQLAQDLVEVSRAGADTEAQSTLLAQLLLALDEAASER